MLQLLAAPSSQVELFSHWLLDLLQQLDKWLFQGNSNEAVLEDSTLLVALFDVCMCIRMSGPPWGVTCGVGLWKGTQWSEVMVSDGALLAGASSNGRLLGALDAYDSADDCFSLQRVAAMMCICPHEVQGSPAVLATALAKQLPVEAVAMIILLWPDSVKVQDNGGYTPLHWAIRQLSSVEVLSLLVSHCPDAVKVQDKYGFTPLHWAIEQKLPVEVVLLLLSHCSDAVKVQDHSGNTPLHWAIVKKSSVEVVSLLLSHLYDAVKVQDHRGNTPLHWAIVKKSSVEVELLLVSHCPDAVKVQDRRGRTPLFSAIVDEKSVEVVSLLVSHCPDAVKVQDKDLYCIATLMR
jgi:hypothetical protein